MLNFMFKKKTQTSKYLKIHQKITELWSNYVKIIGKNTQEKRNPHGIPTESPWNSHDSSFRSFRRKAAHHAACVQAPPWPRWERPRGDGSPTIRILWKSDGGWGFQHWKATISWEKTGKTMENQQTLVYHEDIMGIYPLVICYIAIENGQL